MNTLRRFVPKNFSWIAAALAVGGGLAPAAGVQAGDLQTISLMLTRDVGQREAAPLGSALKTQLEQRAGVALTWTATTRTNAQILGLPSGLTRDAARQVAARLGEVEGVLWAEVNEAAPSIRARTDGAEQSTIHQFVVKLHSTETPGPKLVALLSKTAGIPMALQSRTAGGGWIFELKRPVTDSDADRIESNLESLADVKYADPVTIKHSRALTPDDPMFQDEWFLQDPQTYPGSSNVQAAWSLTQGSNQVTVAVVDSGILFSPTHPDLKDRLTDLKSKKKIQAVSGEKTSRIAGWDMISQVWRARDGDGRDPNPGDEGDWVAADTVKKYPQSCSEDDMDVSSWHGSHVAGTIAAKTNNGIGISGVDWNARLLPVRVLGACGGLTTDINDGVAWAAGQKGIKGTQVNQYPAQVINLSLGGRGDCSDSEQETIDFALAQKAVVVVAAGNSATEAGLESPGNCRGVITVSSVDKLGNLAYYSNYSHDDVVDLAAPGGETRTVDADGVLSTVNNSKTRPKTDEMDYTYMQGTSMATPVVSGVVSLMLAVDGKKQLTPAKVKAILRQTVRPFPAGTRCAEGGDKEGACGSGIIDANAAVKAVQALP